METDTQYGLQSIVIGTFEQLRVRGEEFLSTHTGQRKGAGWLQRCSKLKVDLVKPEYQRGIYGIHRFRDAAEMAAEYYRLQYSFTLESYATTTIDTKVQEILKELQGEVGARGPCGSRKFKSGRG